MLVGLVTVASAGCTFATAVLVEFRERPTRWASGVSEHTEAPPTYTIRSCK